MGGCYPRFIIKMTALYGSYLWDTKQMNFSLVLINSFILM